MKIKDFVMFSSRARLSQKITRVKIRKSTTEFRKKQKWPGLINKRNNQRENDSITHTLFISGFYFIFTQSGDNGATHFLYTGQFDKV